MTQFEPLVLPCMLSITVALIWALILIRDTSSKVSRSLRTTSFAVAVVSILLFIASLFYIIENLGLEAPGKIWETPLLWGWVLLSISFFVIYAGYMMVRETATG